MADMTGIGAPGAPRAPGAAAGRPQQTARETVRAGVAAPGTAPDASRRGSPADAGGARKAPLDEHTLTGPPPAFTATQLEMATNLRLALARLNALGYAQPGRIAPGGDAARPGTEVRSAAPGAGAGAPPAKA